MGTSTPKYQYSRIHAYFSQHTQHQWVVLPMPPAVIAQVNLLGNVEPYILTFTNQRGREIGDNPQVFESSGDDDDSVVKHLTDEIPGVVPAPEDDAVLPGVDTDFDAEPTGVEVDSNLPSRSLMRLMALGNMIQVHRLLRNQALIQPLRLQLRHKLHHPRRGWRHAMPGIGNNLRSIFPACQETITLLH
jgi:hypothetical protein